jgi:hypothetical protein
MPPTSLGRRNSLVQYTSWKEAAEAAVRDSRERRGDSTSDASSDEGSILTCSSNSNSSTHLSAARVASAAIQRAPRSRRSSIASVTTDLVLAHRASQSEKRHGSSSAVLGPSTKRGSASGSGPDIVALRAPAAAPASAVPARRARRASICGLGGNLPAESPTLAPFKRQGSTLPKAPPERQDMPARADEPSRLVQLESQVRVSSSPPPRASTSGLPSP